MAQAAEKRTSNESGWMMALFAAVLSLCAWGLFVGRLQDPLRFWNFGYIHDGSLCLQDRCNPYDTHFLDSIGRQHGEPARPALNPEYPVYPPSTLLLAVPLNWSGWPGSALVFFGLSILSYGAAMVAMVWSVRAGPWISGSAVLLALLSSRSPMMALFYGNPILLCAGLMTVACVFLLASERRHDLPAIALLALALCIKPQLAIGAVVFLLWRRDTRKAAWSALLVFVLFSILATGLYALRLGGLGYLATESRILQLGFQPGHSSDGSLLNPNAFRFLNLEPFMSMFSLGPRAARTAALTIAVLMGALLLNVGRGGTALKRRPWTMLSLVLLLSCVPLYHREYDRCLLLVLAPAAMEAEDHPWLRWLIPVTALLWFWSEPLIPLFLPRIQGVPVNAPLTVILFGLLLWGVRHSDRLRAIPGQSGTLEAAVVT